MFSWLKENIAVRSVAVALGLSWILLFNPWTFRGWYSSGEPLPDLIPAIAISDLYITILVVTTLIFGMRPRMRNYFFNNAVLAASVIFVFFSLKAANFFMKWINPNEDLVFIPHSSAYYRTEEFEYTAKINSYGFRGPEPAVGVTPKTYKVLLLGDSFTFGWGLNYNSTWAALAEKMLWEKGLNVRIFNLSKPGADPIEYGDIAQRAIPVLKPHLVIVNILQGDDLFQTIREVEVKPPTSTQNVLERQMERIRIYFKLLFPRLAALMYNESLFGNSTIDFVITPNWQKQSHEILENFKGEELVRFNHLSSDTRQKFLDGMLNPKMIFDAVKYPDRFLLHEDQDGFETNRSVKMMTDQLKTISKCAQDYSCKVIACMVPHPVYVSKSFQDNYMQMGYQVDSSLLVSKVSEALICRAAEQAGMKFYSPLDHFRSLEKETLYYPKDGHFNTEGAREYARFITKIIADVVSTDQDVP
jgi:lysophospholipase L1-like esterase